MLLLYKCLYANILYKRHWTENILKVNTVTELTLFSCKFKVRNNDAIKFSNQIKRYCHCLLYITSSPQTTDYDYIMIMYYIMNYNSLCQQIDVWRACSRPSSPSWHTLTSIDVKTFLRFLFLLNKNARVFNVSNIFLQLFVHKKVDNSNVPVSTLCTWNVGRTLVLSLEWCDRTPQFSGLSPVRRVIGLHHCIHITCTHTTDSDWHS